MCALWQATNRSWSSVWQRDFPGRFVSSLNVVQIDLPPLGTTGRHSPAFDGILLRRLPAKTTRITWPYEAVVSLLSVIIGPAMCANLRMSFFRRSCWPSPRFWTAGDLPRRIVQSEGAASHSPALADQLGEPENKSSLNTLRPARRQHQTHRRDPRHQPHNALRQTQEISNRSRRDPLVRPVGRAVNVDFRQTSSE